MGPLRPGTRRLIAPRQQEPNRSAVPVRGKGRFQEIAPTDILLEFQVQGNSVKVSAIDQNTGIEVSTIGPATASEAALERAAVRKLYYVLQKRKREQAKRKYHRPGIEV